MVSARRPVQEVQRYALRREEAAAAVGMSGDTFERGVQPFVKVVLCGQLVLVPPTEIERWVRENARILVEARQARA